MATLDEKLDMSLDDLIKFNRVKKPAASDKKGGDKKAGASPMDLDKAKSQRRARGGVKQRARQEKRAEAGKSAPLKMSAQNGISKKTGAGRKQSLGLKVKGRTGAKLALQGAKKGQGAKGTVGKQLASQARGGKQTAPKRLPAHVLPKPHAKHGNNTGDKRRGNEPKKQAAATVDLANMDISSVRAAKRAMKTAKDIISKAEAVLKKKGVRGQRPGAQQNKQQQHQANQAPRTVTREIIKYVPKEVIKYVPVSHAGAGGGVVRPSEQLVEHDYSRLPRREPFAPQAAPRPRAATNAPPPEPRNRYLDDPRMDDYDNINDGYYDDEEALDIKPNIAELRRQVAEHPGYGRAGHHPRATLGMHGSGIRKVRG